MYSADNHFRVNDWGGSPIRWMMRLVQLKVQLAQ